MNTIHDILENIEVGTVSSIHQIQGGRDSSVWKVETTEGAAYAVRLLPKDRIKQFEKERHMMNQAFNAGIPVPKILSVNTYGSFAAMVMEWASGQTILEELKIHPSNASNLGKAFGTAQASFHKIELPVKQTEDWLSPKNEEESEIITQLSLQQKNSVLLHLDYHPLNVMTDGSKVTAILDWANASQGDFRYDIARTYSIFRLVENRLAQYNLSASAFKEFEKGWQAGYELESGIYLKHTTLFDAWAGMRMKTDLSGELTQEEYAAINRRITFASNA